MRSIYKYVAIIATLLILFFIIIKQNNNINRLNNYIDNKEMTIRSYENENNNLYNLIIVQKRSIEELEYSIDSVNNLLINKAKELNIKTKRISELEFISQKATKVDSIFIKDTIFVNDVKIDTSLSNKWYNLNLQLEYPNKVIVQPTFYSELSIIKHKEKEFLKQPKKFFLFRLFQKKILVEKVDVIEGNPYIETKIYRDIEIIK